MAHKLDIDGFIANSRTYPVLDVRSPSEFRQGHLPGAYNLPLFDDDERATLRGLYREFDDDGG